MKNLRLVIGIVVILAIVCSPALAISKSDLLAQYQHHSTELVETLEFDEDTPLNSIGYELHPSHYAIVKPILPAIEPTTISTKAMSDAFLALVPSYYEYSKFAKPEPDPISYEEWRWAGLDDINMTYKSQIV